MDALSPANILMTGTNDSKVESMQDRFNYGSAVQGSVQEGSPYKGIAGQSKNRCNTEV